MDAVWSDVTKTRMKINKTCELFLKMSFAGASETTTKSILPPKLAAEIQNVDLWYNFAANLLVFSTISALVLSSTNATRQAFETFSPSVGYVMFFVRISFSTFFVYNHVRCVKVLKELDTKNVALWIPQKTLRVLIYSHVATFAFSVLGLVFGKPVSTLALFAIDLALLLGLTFANQTSLKHPKNIVPIHPLVNVSNASLALSLLFFVLTGIKMSFALIYLIPAMWQHHTTAEYAYALFSIPYTFSFIVFTAFLTQKSMLQLALEK
jgi:hypothetical protein